MAIQKSYRTGLFRGLIFTSILVFGCIDIYGQGDWVRFRPDALLSFEVDVPAEMGVKTKKIPTGLGELVSTTYAHESDKLDNNFLYVINVTEYPYGVFPEDSILLINEFLKEAIVSLADGVGGDVVYSSELPRGANGIGWLFRLKYNSGDGVIKGKAYMKDNVFITLQAYATKDKSLNDDMDYFLNSFQVKF